MSGGTRIAAVAIGRNEGARLIGCLKSLLEQVETVVYVDSASTDSSVANARSRGLTVVELDASQPFTAARGRNAGAAALRDREPPLDYLFFVDGDCEVVPGWIGEAATFMDSRPNLAAVCGRRRERNRDASIYNRLCDMEWDRPSGSVASCGGDVLMRLAAFEAVGGFDATLIAGEEPDLCYRLRIAGWMIWRLDRDMTHHDAAMTRFAQWWRRTIRAGWTYAEASARHGRDARGFNHRPLLRTLFWGAALPAGVLCLIATAPFLPDVASLVAAAAAGAGLLAYPAMALRIARSRQRLGDSLGDALLYGVFTMLGKIPEAVGVLRFARTRHRHDMPRLIEYKT